MQISEFFESKYRPNQLRGKSQNTLRLYRSSIRLMAKVLGRDPLLTDMTDENIGLVMQNVLDRGGSPYTANKERSQLLAIWRYAAKLGLLTLWPTIMPEKEPERTPKAWMADDVVQLLSAIQKLKGRVGETPESLWWTAIVYVCLDTGERIGALMQATWNNLERDWLLIPAEARKCGKRDRRYQLSSESVQILAKLKEYRQSDRVFHWPYAKTYLWKRYDKILRNAGLPHGPKDKFHRHRKTVGSVAYAAGLDPQDVLDHSSKKVTAKYLDPRMSRQTQPSQILQAWLRGELPSGKDERKQA